MGRLDPPDPAGAARPAERPLDIAEELTRQEVPWEATTVERDEWPMRARPARMNRPGEGSMPADQQRHQESSIRWRTALGATSALCRKRSHAAMIRRSCAG
jgi:hypothetical protein